MSFESNPPSGEPEPHPHAPDYVWQGTSDAVRPLFRPLSQDTLVNCVAKPDPMPPAAARESLQGVTFVPVPGPRMIQTEKDLSDDKVVSVSGAIQDLIKSGSLRAPRPSPELGTEMSAHLHAVLEEGREAAIAVRDRLPSHEFVQLAPALDTLVLDCAMGMNYLKEGGARVLGAAREWTITIPSRATAEERQAIKAADRALTTLATRPDRPSVPKVLQEDLKTAMRHAVAGKSALAEDAYAATRKACSASEEVGSQLHLNLQFKAFKAHEDARLLHKELGGEVHRIACSAHWAAAGYHLNVINSTKWDLHGKPVVQATDYAEAPRRKLTELEIAIYRMANHRVFEIQNIARHPEVARVSRWDNEAPRDWGFSVFIDVPKFRDSPLWRAEGLSDQERGLFNKDLKGVVIRVPELPSTVHEPTVQLFRDKDAFRNAWDAAFAPTPEED